MRTVVYLPDWRMRVCRLAARTENMQTAIAFCKKHNIRPYVSVLKALNLRLN